MRIYHFDLSGILLRAAAGNATESSPRQPRMTKEIAWPRSPPLQVKTSASTKKPRHRPGLLHDIGILRGRISNAPVRSS